VSDSDARRWRDRVPRLGARPSLPAEQAADPDDDPSEQHAVRKPG
jgi:hypothetical protein